jgi:hypothetical protein
MTFLIVTTLDVQIATISKRALGVFGMMPCLG